MNGISSVTVSLLEQLVTPEQFAEHMCEDLRLPPASFIPQIARSIRDQVQDYYLHASSMVTNEPSDTEEDTKLSLSTPLPSVSTPIKSEQQSTVDSPLPSTVQETDTSLQPPKKKSKQNAELRMLIKVSRMRREVFLPLTLFFIFPSSISPWATKP